jgi:hypothetical protein
MNFSVYAGIGESAGWGSEKMPARLKGLGRAGSFLEGMEANAWSTRKSKHCRGGLFPAVL